MKQLILKGMMITQAGLKGEVIKETPKTVSVKITDTFFPKHDLQDNVVYQISKDSQTYLHELNVGQIRKFWKLHPTRTGMEIGGHYEIIKWENI